MNNVQTPVPNYPQVKESQYFTQVTHAFIDQSKNWPLVQPDERTARAYAAEVSARSKSEVEVFGPMGRRIAMYVNGEESTR